MSSILRRNFYVDDMLLIAVDIIHKVKPLCREGDFNLRKFSSNDIII